MTYTDKPDPFFELIIHNIEWRPGLTGASTGYEQGQWRYNELADYILEWLPEFALKYTDNKDIKSHNAIRKIKEAARLVYDSDKYHNRGEYGEILLHALLREVFNSVPAISKLYYKSAVNDTVKGFDAVHIIQTDEGMELWLGEAKFYQDINKAIAEVVRELKSHTENVYLRNEFILISGKIDDNWEYAQELRKLLSTRTSLDKIFKRICIPILLTYESEVISNHTTDSDDFITAIKDEILQIHNRFCKKELPDVKIHLFIVPLCHKNELVDVLHSKLEGLQK